MKERIIFVGDMREEPIYLVTSKETNKRYHKINGKLIEYECVSKYEKLAELKPGYSSTLLCMEQFEDVERERKKARCKRVLYIPELRTWNLDVLLSFVKRGTIEIGGREGIGMGFAGDSLGKLIMEMLIHFPLIESGTKYHLILGVKKQVDTIELTRMEDIIKEYIPMGSKLYINQTILKKPEENYYFLLFV